MHNRNLVRLAGVDPRHVLDRIEDFGSRAPDLMVETAHPDYTRRHGEAILARADRLPLSVTALAVDALRERLIAAAHGSGRNLMPRAWSSRSTSFESPPSGKTLHQTGSHRMP